MKSIAVIFGGKSAEHDVSIITAHVPIIESLLAAGEYDVWPVFISKEGQWYCDKAMNELSFFKQKDYLEKIAQFKKIQLSFDNGLKIVWPGFFSKTVVIDVVFPSMHGTYGEDGSLMGLLRMAQVPFVGCDIFASAVAMDKVLTKQVVSAEGMLVAPYVWFTRDQWKTKQNEIRAAIQKLSWPLFVKPVHLGSSIGISKAKNETELLNAIEVALHFDEKVLVEEGIEPLIEVTLPIMGNDEIITAELERPLNKTEFFDFSDKYLSGGKKGGSGVNTEYSEIPAQIGEELTREVKNIGMNVYRALGCTGIARVDFLINAETKKIYVNEVNTLPGSLYHHNWRKVGVSNAQLVTRLIALAEERYEKNRSTTYAFNSNILDKVGGPKAQA